MRYLKKIPLDSEMFVFSSIATCIIVTILALIFFNNQIMSLTAEMLPYLGFALLIGIIGIQLFFEVLIRLFGEMGEGRYGGALPLKWSAAEVVLIIFLLLTVFIEEMIFRGPIYWTFHNQFSLMAWVAIVVSGFIFGILHLVIYKYLFPGDFMKFEGIGGGLAVIGIILLGVLFGWLTVQTGSLAPPMICHAAVNSVGMVGEAFDKYGTKKVR